MDMFVGRMDLRVEVQLRLIPPHEAEMILSNYQRETGEFVPESVKISWTQFSNGGAAVWATAEVSGRRAIKRGARARVEYREDDNGEIGHWPAYVRDAFQLARDQVLSSGGN